MNNRQIDCSSCGKSYLLSALRDVCGTPTCDSCNAAQIAADPYAIATVGAYRLVSQIADLPRYLSRCYGD